MDARCMQWLGPKEHIEEYCGDRGVYSDTRLSLREQKHRGNKGNAPVRSDGRTSEMVPSTRANGRDGAERNSWRDCILPNAGISGEQSLRDHGHGAEHKRGSREGLSAGKEAIVSSVANVQNGHWNETEEAIANVTGEGLRTGLDILLNGMSYKALARMDEILDLPIDPKERALISEIRKTAEVTLNLQFKVDETKLRQKNVGVLEQVLALIEAA